MSLQQYGGNSYPRSNSGKGTSQDGTREDKDSERMENTNKSQRCQEFPWIRQFLPTIYLQLQSHSKAIKWVKGQEGMEMRGGTSKGIWRAQGKDNKSTGSFFTKKREKIQGGNGCIRTCYKGSTIPRTRWKMETDSIFIKNNATSRNKLQDLWQGAIGNSKGSIQVETISVGHNGTFWNLDRPWKLEILMRTSQVKWTTSSVVFKVIGLWFYAKTYTRKDEYKDKHSFKERISEYQRGQQGCSTPKERILAMKDNSKNHNDKKEDDSRRKQYTQGD